MRKMVAIKIHFSAVGDDRGGKDGVWRHNGKRSAYLLVASLSKGQNGRSLPKIYAVLNRYTAKRIR